MWCRNERCKNEQSTTTYYAEEGRLYQSQIYEEAAKRIQSGNVIEVLLYDIYIEVKVEEGIDEVI